MRGKCEVDGKIQKKLQGNLRDSEMGNTEIHAISIASCPCHCKHTLTSFHAPVLHILCSWPLYVPHQPMPQLVPIMYHKNMDGIDPIKQECCEGSILECGSNFKGGGVAHGNLIAASHLARQGMQIGFIPSLGSPYLVRHARCFGALLKIECGAPGHFSATYLLDGKWMSIFLPLA